MKTRLSIDRFEGDQKEVAILLTDEGTPISLPKRLLPRGARAGDVLSLTLERDPRASRQLADQTRAIQEELKKTDPGGDLKL